MYEHKIYDQKNVIQAHAGFIKWKTYKFKAFYVIDFKIQICSKVSQAVIGLVGR